MAGDRRRTAMVPEIHQGLWRVTQLVLKLIFDGYFKTHVSGRENIPPEGVATLVASNHASSLDVFAAGHALGRSGFFLAKREATEMPVFGRFLKGVGAIPAQRDGRDMTAVKLMLKVLERGHLLGVAPEGTRSKDGRLGDFDPGFVWLAARTGARIVPCAIHGTWQRLPKGSRFPQPGALWVRFAPPVVVGVERPPKERTDEVASEVRGLILGMLRDLAAETGVSSPALE
jgi:1-acyl-sn-glycerol-3-phosphate acyltransferase